MVGAAFAFPCLQTTKVCGFRVHRYVRGFAMVCRRHGSLSRTWTSFACTIASWAWFGWIATCGRVSAAFEGRYFGLKQYNPIRRQTGGLLLFLPDRQIHQRMWTCLTSIAPMLIDLSPVTSFYNSKKTFRINAFAFSNVHLRRIRLPWFYAISPSFHVQLSVRVRHGHSVWSFAIIPKSSASL